MLNHSPSVARLFHALADPNRRHMVEQLSRGPASVTELAKPLGVSLAAVVQHLQLLEETGLVRTRKVGRTRTCYLRPQGLRPGEKWLADRRARWEQRFDRLGALLEDPNFPDTHKEHAR